MIPSRRIMGFSKGEYYKFFAGVSSNLLRNSEIPWTLLPTRQERVLAHARRMLKYYQEQNDTQAILDMEWIITEIEKELA